MPREFFASTPPIYCYHYWWGEGWNEGTEECLISKTPLSTDDIIRVAREQKHLPVTYIHEFGKLGSDTE